MTDLKAEWGKRIQVMIVHQAFIPVNMSDNIDEHAEWVHVALSSTSWYRNQKEGQLIVHPKT